jgi:DNA repair protein RecN (Recombination protein N)
MGIDLSEGFMMKRILSSQGRSRAYLNGSMVNLQTLAEISGYFIDIHGQYEHQYLLSPDNQLEFLDTFGGLIGDADEVGTLYKAYGALKQRMSELQRTGEERARRLDMLRFQTDEIRAAGLTAGEEKELEEEAGILGNAVRLSELAHEAYDSLYSSESSCISVLERILANLREISGIDAGAREPAGSVEDAVPLLQEAAYFLRDYREKLNFSPERLDSVQERLEQIRGLKRKYGGSIEEILLFQKKAEEELESLMHLQENMESLTIELEGMKNEFTRKAKSLSKKRREAVKKIEPLVVRELSGLSMPDTRFSVRVSQEPGEDTADQFQANAKGVDKIEFLLSPNKGEKLKPLSSIASGGELSRIMLALKGIIAGGDRVPIMVFDEIDAGIGGIAAGKVGERLKLLSARHQVICITHLPKIASFADRHLRIEKKAGDERMTVEVRKIEEDERTGEIARMLSGKSSKVSLKHAEELLRSKNQ